MGNSTENTNFKQLKDRNFVEFEQLAFIALVKKNNGAVSVSSSELKAAHGFECEVDTTFPDKVVFRVKPRTNIDEKKAQEFFEEARKQQWHPAEAHSH